MKEAACGPTHAVEGLLVPSTVRFGRKQGGHQKPKGRSGPQDRKTLCNRCVGPKLDTPGQNTAQNVGSAGKLPEIGANTPQTAASSSASALRTYPGDQEEIANKNTIEATP